MTVSKTLRQMRLREWSKQIIDCENSGISVSEWCERNGVGYKNYYYRKRRVREELLDSAESSGNSLVVQDRICKEISGTIFAAVPASAGVSSGYGMAATVQIGTYTAEIKNGADMETIEGVLRTLSRL